MWFSLPSATFSEILRTAKLAMMSKPRLAVLSALHLQVTPDGRTLEITSTDLDVSLTQRVPLDEPGGPGACCIPLAGLTAVKPDKKTPVRIDFAPHAKSFSPDAPNCQILYVAGGQSAKADLDTLAVKEFPVRELPPPDAFTCLFPARTMKAIIDSLAFQSDDQTRYVLNGACLDPAEGGSVVATNGRVLGRWKTKVTPEKVILPAKACHALARMGVSATSVCLPPPADKVQRVLHFRHGRHILTTKLIEGNYPNYHAVIPARQERAITFADAPGVAKWLATLDANPVHLHPRAPHYVDMIHPQGRITATAYLQNEPPEIAFNPAYLADALAAVGGTLYLTDEMSPGTVRNADCLAVVMPMRVEAAEAKPAKTCIEKKPAA